VLLLQADTPHLGLLEPPILKLDLHSTVWVCGGAFWPGFNCGLCSLLSQLWLSEEWD